MNIGKINLITKLTDALHVATGKGKVARATLLETAKWLVEHADVKVSKDGSETAIEIRFTQDLG